MKSNSLINNNTITTNNNTKVPEVEDEEEMFGSRSYASSFCGPRPNRPTMISAKYRQKEERRKVLKISINKLKKIEDPESSLRRSVLINNTMKRLQREAREEKMNKTVGRTGVDAELADITNLPEPQPKEEPAPRKRAIEEVDESDVHAVLSQFYMPLTPRMLTSIDEDEEDLVDVVDVGEDPAAKRPRLLEEPKPAPYSCGHSSMFNELQSVVYHSLIASLET